MGILLCFGRKPTVSKIQFAKPMFMNVRIFASVVSLCCNLVRASELLFDCSCMLLRAFGAQDRVGSTRESSLGCKSSPRHQGFPLWPSTCLSFGCAVVLIGAGQLGLSTALGRSP